MADPKKETLTLPKKPADPVDDFRALQQSIHAIQPKDGSVKPPHTETEFKR